MALHGMPALSAAEQAALDHDYRHGPTRLIRQRSHMVLLSQQLDTQAQIAQVVRCSQATVARTLQRYREGGRAALPRRVPPTPPAAHVTPAWRQALAQAMTAGPQACGVPRPTWTAPLLAHYLAEQTGIAVSERTVRRELDKQDYVCRRPTWTVRAQAEAQPDYLPKRKGSKR